MNSFPGTGLTACQRLSFGSLDDRRRSSSACSGSVSDRKSTRLNSSHLGISYAVFCLKKKKKNELTYRQPDRTAQQQSRTPLKRRLTKCSRDCSFGYHVVLADTMTES